jgi:hypothetical protein
VPNTLLHVKLGSSLTKSRSGSDHHDRYRLYNESGIKKILCKKKGHKGGISHNRHHVMKYVKVDSLVISIATGVSEFHSESNDLCKPCL